MINIALSPNVTSKDVLTAIKLLFLPWKWLKWRNDESRAKLSKRFSEFAGTESSFLVGSGREALFLILKSLELAEQSEVILQSFTCMVVSNAIVWNKLKPVYVDIDETFNLDPDKIEAQITPKTRVILVQHTFGIPAQILRIREICRKNNLILIEDCAHALGAEALDADGTLKKLGTFGDAAFFSLGRSKVISAVSGGAIISKNLELAQKIAMNYEKIPEMKYLRIFQNLFHPLITGIAKLTYGIGLGKLMMVLAQKLHLINLEVTAAEKRGEMEGAFPTKLAGAMAVLGNVQMDLLSKFNEHRKTLAAMYHRELGGLSPINHPGAIFLRFPVIVDHPELIFNTAKKHGFILGDWYSVPIAPKGVDLKKSGYINGSCSNAEKIGKKIINLPTMYSFSEKKAKKLIDLIKKYIQK